ncbi:MAG TPA: DsrE family protein [Gammaproteobacteria bacterium]
MSDKKTLTFAFMDPPFESGRTTAFFRLLDAAVRRNCNINVFAYEGAVALAFAKQQAHANSVHGRNVEEENHPLTKDWIAALISEAKQRGLEFNWVNCGLCVDERGVNEAIEGTRRGSPADFYNLSEASDNVLVIATR